MTVSQEQTRHVLRFLADRSTHPTPAFEAGPPADTPHPELPDLTQAEVLRAVELLEDDGYVRYGNREGYGNLAWIWFDLRVTGRGKQELGDWPRFEALGQADTLAAVIEALADRVPPDEAENYRRTGRIIRGAEAGAQSFATGLLLKLLSGQLPI